MLIAHVQPWLEFVYVILPERCYYSLYCSSTLLSNLLLVLYTSYIVNLLTTITCVIFVCMGRKHTPGKKERIRVRFIVKNTRQILDILPHGTTANRIYLVQSKIKLRQECYDSVCIRTFGYEASTTGSIALYKLASMWNAIFINFLITCTRAFGCDRMLNDQYFTYIHGYPRFTHQRSR